MSARDVRSMREARRIAGRMHLGETGQARRKALKAPEPLPGAGYLVDELSERIIDTFQGRTLCLPCLRETDCFYLVAGSADFYMKQLARLGVPPEGAVMLAGLRGSSIGGMRRAPCCPPCALLAGMEKMPMSSAEISLRAADGLGSEQPVPVAILAESEELARSIIAGLNAQDRKRQHSRKKQEAYEMRLKGAHKDVADFFGKLEKGEVEGIQARGYLTEVSSSGHIKVYHGEPGRAVASDGRFVTTVSQTPRNPGRTIRNAEGLIRKWERENLDTEPEAEEMPRQYNQRTDAEKAAIVARYDYADEAKQRELLAKYSIRHRDITRFREQLAERGWNVAAEPVPLPDELDRTQMCATCGKDKALTRDNFTQEKIQGKYTWSKKCNTCKDQVPEKKAVIIIPEPEPAALRDPGVKWAEDDKPDAPLDNTEATRMITLMGRKRDISARLAVIGEEKARKVKALEEEMARLTRELDEERKRLTAERDQVENDLLELVSG